MFKKALKVFTIVTAVTVLSLLSTGSVWTADDVQIAGTSPEMAMSPAAGTVTIEPGQWHWYTFRSQLPFNAEKDKGFVVTRSQDATIDAVLYSKSDQVGFEVWNADDLNDFRKAEEFDPLGNGTENKYIDGDPLTWQGSFSHAENFYLIVMNSGTESASYNLSITGHVSFPSAHVMAAAQPAAEPEIMTEQLGLAVDLPAKPEAETIAAAGASPEMAMAPSGESMTIEPGQWHWYTFRSQLPFNVEKDTGFVVTRSQDATVIAMLTSESDKVGFEVWNADDLNDFRKAEEFDPLGNGTENKYIDGDPLTWQGSFSHAENFYLIVMNSGTESASYNLSITGHVSFPSAHVMAAAQPAAEPEIMTEQLGLSVDLPAKPEAETVAGTSPEMAVAPSGESMAIEPGQWHWYTFRSQLPVNAKEQEGFVVTRAKDATVIAMLTSKSKEVGFEVWNADDLNAFRKADEFDPLGTGTKNENIDGDPLTWQGSFSHAENFYLIVMNSGTESASYDLSITGHVSFPSAHVMAAK